MAINVTLTVYGVVDEEEEPTMLDSATVQADTINDLYSICESIEQRLLANEAPRISQPLIALMQWENGMCTGNTTFCSLKTYRKRHDHLVEQALNLYNQ